MRTRERERETPRARWLIARRTWSRPGRKKGRKEKGRTGGKEEGRRKAPRQNVDNVKQVN